MWEALSQAQSEGHLVDLKREGIGCPIRGFVSSHSADLVLVSVVSDECEFNGAIVVRREDISFLRWNDEVLKAWTKVLQESPTSPAPLKHVDLASTETVVNSLAGREPVITFHRDIVNDDVCHIGTNVVVEGECVIADEISVEGTIDGRFALRIGDVTRIDFGGGYEKALWRMVRSAQ